MSFIFSSPNQKNVFCLLFVLSFFIGEIFSQEKNEESAIGKELLSRNKTDKGVVIINDQVEISLIKYLVKVSSFRFYGCLSDAAEVEKFRAVLRQSGITAERVRIELGSIEQMNYPYHIANILLSNGDIDANKLKVLAGLIRPEGWLYVSVVKGKGVSFELKDFKNLLTQNGNKDWLEPIKVSTGFLVQRASIEGVGDWSHYYRAPDNNRYSSDKFIKAPLSVKWYGDPVEPLGDLFLTQGFSAGGRLFLTDASPNDTSKARITCLDAYNGSQLWVREVGESRFEKPEGVKGENVAVLHMPGWVQPGSMVVSASRIYLTDNNECLVLDSYTGKDILRFKLPPVAHAASVWRFIANENGLLIGFSNASTAIPVRGKPTPESPADCLPLIFALNAENGSVVWSRGGNEADELGKKFDRPLAIGGGQIFLRSNNTLFALDEKTGKTTWKVEVTEDPNAPTWWEAAVSGNSFLLYKYNLRSWSDKKAKSASVSFSVKDGKIENEITGDLSKENFFDSKIGFLGAPTKPRLGCNYGSAAGNLYFYRNNYFVEKEGALITAGQTKSYGGFRAGCGVGVLPANGLVHLLPNGLGCGCAALRGTVALQHDPNAEVTYEKFTPQPVVTDAKIANEKPAAESDWPTYLADPARSGVTKQEIPSQVSILWQNKLSGELTPCVAVGDKVFFGSSDECVYAIDSNKGNTAWFYQTTGAIRCAPVYWEGRIFVGSDDGWLYTLSAEDGKLLWKLYGGPTARRQICFENMISPWPIRQGIIVEAGKVYFTAGLLPGADIYSYCADAKTGQILWRTPVGKTSIVPCGYLLGYEDKILLPSPGSAAIYHPVVLGKADGVRQKYQITHGDFAEVRYVPPMPTEEIGYDKGLLIYGGSKGARRGYREGAGYMGKEVRYDNAYKIMPVFYDEGKTKMKAFNIMGDGSSFLPMFVSDKIVMRFQNKLTAISKNDLFKFLETRDIKLKEAMFQWSHANLPCGVPDWFVAATGNKVGQTPIVLAGGPNGVSAVHLHENKILWSESFKGSTLPPAICNGSIYLTSADGTVFKIGQKR